MTSAHSLLLDHLTALMHERLEDYYHSNPSKYRKGNLITAFHRRQLASELWGLRKAIRHTRSEALRARMAA